MDRRAIDADIQHYVFDVPIDAIWSYDEKPNGSLVADSVYDDVPHWSDRDNTALAWKLLDIGISLEFVAITPAAPARIIARKDDRSTEYIFQGVPEIDVGACIAVLRLVDAPGYDRNSHAPSSTGFPHT